MKLKKFKKQLGFLDIFCIATGAMISSGIFILPGIAFAQTGPAIIIAYLIAGILMIPTVLTKAELTTAMPKAGGTYFFVERSLGAFAGVLSGFANWFSICLKSAFALIGMGAFLKIFFPALTYQDIQIGAVVFTIFFTFVNLFSVRIAGKLQILLVFFLLFILSLYCSIGFRFVIPSHYSNFFEQGWNSLIATTGLVFISFAGLTKIAAIGEEVKKPGKNIPWAMLSALLAVNILYVLVVDITVGLVPPDQLKNSLMPITQGAAVFSGTWGIILTTMAALIAFITTANAGILSASRIPIAMSRDGLLPEFFQKMNHRSLPHISIYSTSGFIIFSILLFNLPNLVKLASTLILFLFLMINVSLIMMRESKISGYRPQFKAPLYPWLQIFSIGVYGLLIIQMSSKSFYAISLFIFVSFLWYFFYSRKGLERKSALMHVVERIIAKDQQLMTSTLEEELRNILIERDDIIEDRFDQLIRKAEILDINKSISLEDFFHVASKKLVPLLNLEENRIFRLFVEREKQSSTEIRSGLAVPHIIVPGEGIFTILLARSRKGIVFNQSGSRVKIIFVLAGSLDERNFYLRALMSIAQIAQKESFEEEWLESTKKEELRNIILFSSRNRGGK